MTDANDAALAVRCFLSYSRDDAEAMNGIAVEIKKRLEGFYRASTGRTLHIFVDREDIGWGEDWREKIAGAVRDATVFMPLITMNYFTREACREELTTFYRNADLLGVTDLILPIVLAGSSRITADDSREEVRIIERLQFIPVEDAWPQGFSSPAWTTAMFDITKKLMTAVERAESRIGTIETAEHQPSAPSFDDSDPDDEGEDDPESAVGLYDLMHDFMESIDGFKEVSPAASADMSDFFDKVAETFEGLNGAPDRRALNQRALAASGPLLEVATRLNSSAGQMLKHVSTADAAIRQVAESVAGSHVPELQDGLRDALASMNEVFEGSEDLPAQMDQIVRSLKFARGMNVSLRNAFQVGQRGMAAVRDAIKIFRSWEDLVKN